MQGAAFDLPEDLAVRLMDSSAELTSREFELDLPKSLPLEDDRASGGYGARGGFSRQRMPRSGGGYGGGYGGGSGQRYIRRASLRTSAVLAAILHRAVQAVGPRNSDGRHLIHMLFQQ